LISLLPMKNYYIFLFIVFCSFTVNAQVGIGTQTPDPSSILELESTDGGLLIPRMEESDRIAIAGPVQGLLVYQTNNQEGFWYHNGLVWLRLLSNGEFVSDSGVVHNTTDIAGDDFVFGSTQLDDMSGSDDNQRMFFDKGKGAFRVGYNDNTDWDNANLGTYSAALGRDNLVSGTYGMALGYDHTVTGTAATGIGLRHTVSGDYATAIGRTNTASGNQSFATGIASRATGLNSIALGNTSDATAENSIAMGRLNDATALNSVAIGFTNKAFAENSFSLGNDNTNLGVGSFSLGNNLTSPSGSEIVVGTYNERYTPASATGFNENDRLFTVGNGSRTNGVTTFSNAFTILKNAQTGINTATPQSSLDIRAQNHLGSLSSTDGVLVPRVTDLVSDGNENGQLVFLNTDWINTMSTPSTVDDINYFMGFHYWNATSSAWTPINSTIEPWNLAGTNDPATLNSQNLYTMGQVGIGTNNPLGALHITTENSRDVLFLRFIDSLDDDLDIDLFRSRGSVASPSLLSDGTRLGGLRGQSLTNAGSYTFNPAAEIFFKSDGASSAGSSPGSITMSTTPSGSVSTLDRLVIRQDGDIGINQPDPEAKLDINGTVRITDGTQGSESLLTGDVNGDAAWDRRAITKHVKAYMPATNEFLVDITWIEIKSHGTNGELVIENTHPTDNLSYSWNSDNNNNSGSGTLTAGSSVNIVVGFVSDIEIMATKFSSVTDSSIFFKGMIIVGNVKGFITFDQY